MYNPCEFLYQWHKTWYSIVVSAKTKYLPFKYHPKLHKVFLNLAKPDCLVSRQAIIASRTYEADKKSLAADKMVLS